MGMHGIAQIPCRTAGRHKCRYLLDKIGSMRSDNMTAKNPAVWGSQYLAQAVLLTEADSLSVGPEK